MIPLQNLLSNLPDQLPEEVFETLVQTPQIRIERILSRGHASPPGFWYDQPEAEWITLLQGTARLEFEDHTVDLIAGDALLIPAHVRHRVAETDPQQTTIWLAVFYESGSRV